MAASAAARGVGGVEVLRASVGDGVGGGVAGVAGGVGGVGVAAALPAA